VQNTGTGGGEGEETETWRLQNTNKIERNKKKNKHAARKKVYKKCKGIVIGEGTTLGTALLGSFPGRLDGGGGRCGEKDSHSWLVMLTGLGGFATARHDWTHITKVGQRSLTC